GTDEHTRRGDAVAPDLYPVAHHRAQLAPARAPHPAVGPGDGHLAAVVFQVGQFGPGSQVAIAAQQTVAHIIKVGRLGPVQQHAPLELRRVADAAAGPDEAVAPYVRAVADDGALADPGGPHHHGSRLDDRAGAHVHRALDEGALHHRPLDAGV